MYSIAGSIISLVNNCTASALGQELGRDLFDRSNLSKNHSVAASLQWLLSRFGHTLPEAK